MAIAKKGNKKKVNAGKDVEKKELLIGICN
jgi:hypothetical protein